jgi:hypothetical protein
MKNGIKISKSIVLVVITIMSLCFVSYIVALACQNGFDYARELIVFEQEDHYIKMKKHIERLDYAINDFEKIVDNIENNKLTQDDRKSIQKQLRELEEIKLNISRETLFYQEDNTVHWFFTPRNEIVDYFGRTRNTPLYIDRFVRSIELGLFEKQLTKNQKEIIKKNYELLCKELDE